MLDTVPIGVVILNAGLIVSTYTGPITPAVIKALVSAIALAQWEAVLEE